MLVFLFTDIAGSSRSCEDHTDQMGAAIARHDEILQELREGHGAAAPNTLATASGRSLMGGVAAGLRPGSPGAICGVGYG